MATAKTKSKRSAFGIGLGTEQLTGMNAQLQYLRSAPPLVKRADGKYEGDILGFVKGLRLSAGVIYFLQQRLGEIDVEVSWGHLVDEQERSCSPECDVIIHLKGSIQKWNGTDKPIMEFKFVKVSRAKVVVSCKSQLRSIDKDYPQMLKKFGVKKVFLFAECCNAGSFKGLRERAKRAGYADLCCLYFTTSTGFVEVNKSLWSEFGDSVEKAAKK
jgi:hypothetical protein